jgi:hypothetical protein
MKILLFLCIELKLSKNKLYLTMKLTIDEIKCLKVFFFFDNNIE